VGCAAWHCRQRAPSRQFSDLLVLAEEEKVSADEKCADLRSDHRSECYVNLIYIRRMKYLQLYPQRTGALIQNPRFGFGIAIGRVHQQGDIGSLRHQFVQYLDALRNQIRLESRDPSNVPARMVEASHEPKLDWVNAKIENDWNRRSRCLGH